MKRYSQFEIGCNFAAECGPNSVHKVMSARIGKLTSFMFACLVCTGAQAIVNGHEVSEDDFMKSPILQASVAIHAGGQLCSGVLITRTAILTAAHCLAGIDDPKSIRVAIRSIDERRGTLGHPGYRSASRLAVFPATGGNGETLPEDDIALIFIEESWQFPTASFLREPFSPGDFVDFLAYGYGRNEKQFYPASPGNGPLRTTNFNSSELVQGQNVRVKGIITFDGERTSPCKGDSGGPVFGVKSDGTYIIIGISHSVSPRVPKELEQVYDEQVATGKQSESEFIDSHPNINMCDGFASYVSVAEKALWISHEIDAN